MVGVDLDGVKHVLGIWVENTEGAKFWLSVCTELRNRGVRDVLIACCDGLAGLPEAMETVWPRSVVQTCTVHLIRAAMRYVACNDRRRFAAALKPVYTAATVDAAQDALLELADSPLGRKYKAAIAVWERAWDRFTPFLAFPPENRKNHLHHQRHRVVQLPDPQNHQEPRPVPHRRRRGQADLAGHHRHRGPRERARAAERGKARGKRTAPGRLIEGHAAQGWRHAPA